MLLGRGLRLGQAARTRVAGMYGMRRGMASESPYDVVVIGSGPGGYIAGIRAGQLGLKTAVIEKNETLGGTCLNVGCIPSKALLHNTALYHTVEKEGKARGLSFDNLTYDLSALMAQKEKAVKTLTGGVAMLFKKNKVDWIKGTASFASPTSVEVALSDGGSQTVEAKNFIVATGSESTPFPGVTVDEKKIVTSTGALSLEKVPEKLVIIGAGVIGLELGSVYARLGSKVEVVEFAPGVGGAAMDQQVAKTFQKILQKQGFEFHLSTKVLGAEVDGDDVKVKVEPVSGGDAYEITGDTVLLSIGRRPYTEGLNVENAGLEIDGRGRVVIDDHFGTSQPHIKCIGDVTFGPMLAHKAEEEGVAAADLIAGKAGHVNYNNIPSVVYTHPEIAWTGATEQQLKDAGIKYKVGNFPMGANSRARTVDDFEGFVKVLVDAETDKILGVHIIAPIAGDLIAEAGLAIEYGASAEDVARVCHAHPTYSEAVKEASLAAFGKPLNA